LGARPRHHAAGEADSSKTVLQTNGLKRTKQKILHL
jgi:hypothetical protein